MTNETSWSFETKQIHAGQQPDGDTGARALPIYQTTSFVFKDAKQAADRFALAELGPIYTRITNPTQEAVETRIAELEGGVGGLLLASGQSAELLAILNIAEAGDHVVASPNLYGGTYNLLRHTLPKFGITTTFVSDADEPQAWRDAVQPNTKLFFGESIPNPKLNVFDIETVAAIAHENGVPLVIDNTVATPYLIRPFEYGADIVIHSATKYLGGHGTSIAGIIVDGGRFDWSADPEKFPGFNTPDPSYNGLVFKDLGAPAYILKARVQLLRDMGPAISPFNAFLIGQGVETLSLRMDRHIANAQQVAEFLESQDQVTTVGYPGLPSSPWHERARKYAPKGPGAVLTFELAGGYDAGIAFVDALTLHSNVANIGDVRSLVIHPASTTHSQLDDAALAGAGVSPGLVRLAVGLEHIDDIVADITTGLAAAAAVTAGGGGTAA
ncbi:bifunctional o-acetylhomoserine/o-acetylserine sulfhydrylase [Georgenia sp. MJ173]|uniref:bifunctional o-acetylhomoserine/o-acetylserine sulfhydrylase n=1 Tax=Georgenia sunbinii TaxID=3117728 RepID=UPI002F26C2CE